MLGRTLILKTSALKPVEKLVRGSFLFRPLVKRFIAGDTLEESLPACEALIARNLFVSTDFLGENTHSEAEALEAKAQYIRMLHRISERAATRSPRVVPFPTPKVALPYGTIESCNISIKLTQCGLDQGDDFAERNYRDVVGIAAQHDNFVRVDMEASEYTERTVNIVSRVFKDHPNTGTVLQSYLMRTDEDLERFIELGARVRIVKGAYLEPPTVAFKEKSKVDEQYVKQAKRLLDAGFYPAIATHDEAIINEVKRHARENSIDPQTFEFQMLYGIRRDLQDSLVHEGFNVRVYVPFGDSWYPYFTRRLAERPANGLFILKSMFRG